MPSFIGSSALPNSHETDGGQMPENLDYKTKQEYKSKTNYNGKAKND
jgi:hypothetical protein